MACTLLAYLAMVGCDADDPPTRAEATTNMPSPPRSATVKPTPSPTSPPDRGTVVAEEVASNLEFPAAFTVAQTGDLVYGERYTGEIHVIDAETGTDRLLVKLSGVRAEDWNEMGLTGIALDPASSRDPVVYAYATRDEGDGPRGQVLRVEMRGGRATVEVIFDTGEPAAFRHNGGKLAFGPDGMIYLMIGDTERSDQSQDIESPLGKVLRMTRFGRVPNDAPFPGTRTFAFGFRNSFGMAFDPVTGDLWETENGPECNDEINLVVAGANYGWGPHAECDGSDRGTNVDGPDPTAPAFVFRQTIGPTGIAMCDGCGLRAAEEGQFLFGSVNRGEISRLTLSPDRSRVVSSEVVFAHERGVLSLERGPDGSIYFSDGSHIFRLTLAPTS